MYIKKDLYIASLFDDVIFNHDNHPGIKETANEISLF